jgi:hypothetical protein
VAKYSKQDKFREIHTKTHHNHTSEEQVLAAAREMSLYHREASE